MSGSRKPRFHPHDNVEYILRAEAILAQRARQAWLGWKGAEEYRGDAGCRVLKQRLVILWVDGVKYVYFTGSESLLEILADEEEHRCVREYHTEIKQHVWREIV